MVDRECMCVCVSESWSIALDDVYDIDWLLSRSFLISDLDIVNNVIAARTSNVLSGPCNQGR